MRSESVFLTPAGGIVVIIEDIGNDRRNCPPWNHSFFPAVTCRHDYLPCRVGAELSLEDFMVLQVKLNGMLCGRSFQLQLVMTGQTEAAA